MSASAAIARSFVRTMSPLLHESVGSGMSGRWSGRLLSGGADACWVGTHLHRPGRFDREVNRFQRIGRYSRSRFEVDTTGKRLLLGSDLGPAGAVDVIVNRGQHRRAARDCLLSSLIRTVNRGDWLMRGR